MVPRNPRQRTGPWRARSAGAAVVVALALGTAACGGGSDASGSGSGGAVAGSPVPRSVRTQPVTNVATATDVELGSLLPTDKALLVWFWAPL